MEDPFLQLSIIITSGLFACWVARLCHLPSILLMLITGFLVGPVLNWVDPDELLGDLLLPIVSISVAVVLFEGGLSLRLEKVKKIGPAVLLLVAFSTLLGILLGSLFLIHVIGFSQGFSILLASILVITGPTVIIPLLHQLHVKEPVRSILHWEGILIDPVGAIAAVLIFDAIFINHGPALTSIGIELFYSLFVGVGTAVVAAFILFYSLRKFLIPDALRNPVTLLFLVASFALANTLQTDSGLVTATVMGLILANQKKIPIKQIIEFKESLRVILIAFLFVTLAANIDLEVMIEWWAEALSILIFLLVFVRPLIVFLSTLHSNLTWKEKVFMSVVAPRGIVSAAVASIFSLELTRFGYPGGEDLVPIVFSIIVGSVCISGLGAFLLAPRLGLAGAVEPGVLIIGANAVAREVGQSLAKAGFVPHYIDTDYWKATQAKQLQGNVYHGSFVSFQEDYPDVLDDVGMVMALTENDDINVLAINHLSHFFNQEQLYQLRTNNDTLPEHLTGRLLFSEKISNKILRNLILQGAKIQSLQLEESRTFKEWHDLNSQAIPLFYIPKNGPIESIDKLEKFQNIQKGRVLFLTATFS